MKYKIKHKWVNNSNIKTKGEQILEIEGFRFTLVEILNNLDKFVSLILKSKEELKERSGEIKHIMEEFIIDVCSSIDLK